MLREGRAQGNAGRMVFSSGVIGSRQPVRARQDRRV